MVSKYQRLFPTIFERISLVFVGLLVVVVGNGQQLLSYYGLTASNQVLKQNAGETISKGLSRLDNLSVTNQLVTFLIWAVVGLLCFSIAQAIAYGYQEFQREEGLSSNRYVHPNTFVRRLFWRQVALSFVTFFVGVVVLGVVLYGFFGYVLAIGLTYTQVFLQGISILHLGYFLLGLAVIYVGLFVLDIAVRFLLRRRQLFS